MRSRSGGFSPAKDYQLALYEAGIPQNAFAVSDVQREYERLVDLGVDFQSGPVRTDSTMIAIFDDTCGNWIQLYEA